VLDEGVDGAYGQMIWVLAWKGVNFKEIEPTATEGRFMASAVL